MSISGISLYKYSQRTIRKFFINKESGGDFQQRDLDVSTDTSTTKISKTPSDTVHGRQLLSHSYSGPENSRPENRRHWFPRPCPCPCPLVELRTEDLPLKYNYYKLGSKEKDHT